MTSSTRPALTPPAAPATPAAPTTPRQLRLGIFAPNSRHTSASAFRYITSLARQVQRVTSIPTVGRSYRSAAAFRRASRGLHFAVVDPVYLCRRPHAVLASGRLGGSSRPPWGLYARRAANLGQLKGKRLALASSGAGDISFAEAMIGGRVKIRRYFSAVVFRKDLRSAINAVKAGQADAVLAPAAMATGLRRIFSSPRVPNAGLVRLKPLRGKLANKVLATLRKWPAAGVGGWGRVARYRCPSGRVRYPMALVKQRPLRLPAATFLRKRRSPPGAKTGTGPRSRPAAGYRLPALLPLFRAP